MALSSATADIAQTWRGEPDGPISIGSGAHKTLFCRMLLETFDPYRPAILDWPALSGPERRRLTDLPIWDIAVQTEAGRS